ncbi:unnamed protein product [Linum trigynum]|uniref:Protein BRANCHLESS TRICHOME n=1 Tax=Linum trigynum TaxID=586398 RepID=A0AAV2DL86_9ROSI
MMMVSSSSISSNYSETGMNDPSMLHDDPIPTSPTWKLYRNPYFISNSYHSSSSHHHHKSPHLQRSHSASSRGTGAATAFWDLTFFKMEENQTVMELKAELDYERKLRKKAESLNKRLAREAAEERSGKEALERVCENLARKVSADAAEMDRMRREMEEERKMLRVAEVLREERVQMKLSDARIVWEEKMSEILSLLHEKGIEEHWGIGLGGKEEEKKGNDGEAPPTSLAVTGDSQAAAVDLPGKCRKLIIGGDKWWWDEVGGGSRDRGIAGGSGVGAIENPHIRRGIKGFVEFRRVVRGSSVVGSKNSSSRQWGTKLECQKAQLKILLKQRSPIRSSTNTLIIS